MLPSEAKFSEGKVCLQCGDKGSTNAFVYCVKCLKFAVHRRYCLAVIPETLDEFVHWVCGDDCEGEAPKKSARRNHKVLTCFGRKQNDLLAGPYKLSDGCTEVDLVNCGVSPEDERQICPPSLPEHLDVEKEKGDLMRQTAKKSKKRKRDIIDSVINKNEYSLDNVVSCKEENKKLVEMARGTKLSSKVKDDRHSEHIDQNRVSAKSSKKKKKKKKKTIISSEENHLENQPAEEMTGSACDTKLPYKMKDNKGSEQGDEKQISVKSPKKKKKKKKTTISAGEDHPENQCAEEMTGSACDTKLPSKVKDDKGSEQGDEKQISAKSSKKKKKNTISSSQENLLENQHAQETTEFTCDTKLACNMKDDTGSERRDKECISAKRSKKKKRKAILSENKPLDLGNQCDEKSIEQKNYCPSEAGIGNRELEDREKRNSSNSDKNNICEDFPPVVSSAEPVAMPIWRGRFYILNEKRGILNGLLAHVSVLACPKVYDEALQFRPVLHLEMLPKSDVWPKSFTTSEPCGDNIALYFFPSKSRYEMMHKELALKAIVQNAELLIFNSSELPLLYWNFKANIISGEYLGKSRVPLRSPTRVEWDPWTKTRQNIQIKHP
ncbi:hypothetical protein OROGR_021557 [Orobanche gracilis]